MSTGTKTKLAPSLREALDGITIDTDRHTAVVGGRVIEAADPRELRRLLAEAFYERLHAGMTVEKSDLALRLQDHEFDRVLDSAVPHRTSTARVIVRETGASKTLVEREGVRIWVPSDRIPGVSVPRPGEVVTITTSSRRPLLSPGFFLVDGSRPYAGGEHVLRVYIHISRWQAAARIFSDVLMHLEDAEVAYRAKVISSKLLYPRQDALVVYLGEPSWPVVPELTELTAGMTGIGHGTSVFAERLGDGISIAWEPADRRPGMQGMSFGQHRAAVLAEALLDKDSGTSAEERVAVAFAEADIDPASPARNLISPGFHGL